MKHRWKTAKRRRRQYFLKQRICGDETTTHRESETPDAGGLCFRNSKKTIFLPLSLFQGLVGSPSLVS